MTHAVDEPGSEQAGLPGAIGDDLDSLRLLFSERLRLAQIYEQLAEERDLLAAERDRLAAERARLWESREAMSVAPDVLEALDLPRLRAAEEQAREQQRADRRAAANDRARMVSDLRLAAELIDRYEAELSEEQVQSEELDETIELQHLVVLGMAHDLRGPLSVMVGHSDLVAERFDEMSRDALVQSARHVAETGRHLAKIVLDFLDLERSSRAGMPVKLNDVDVAAIAADIVERLPLDVERVVIEPDTLTASCDRRIFERIIDNLVTNAATHAGTDGEVVVSLEVDQGCLLVSVADDGPGIPEDVRDRLFQPFWRSADSPGTGVGLHLVQRLATLHGGRVWVADREGGGTVFHVELCKRGGRLIDLDAAESDRRGHHHETVS